MFWLWLYAKAYDMIHEYRVVQKIGTPLLYALPLPNINRFSKLFHCQNREKICNNTITKVLGCLMRGDCKRCGTWSQAVRCTESGSEKGRPPYGSSTYYHKNFFEWHVHRRMLMYIKVGQELITRWDTRTWRDISPICLLIYHWTTTHLNFRHIFWVTRTCYISNGSRFTKSALRIWLLSTCRVSSTN